MAKKPKNLNQNSNREFLRKQRDLIDEQLREEPELYKNDFLEYFDMYIKSLDEHEFAANTKKVYLRNAKWFIDNYTSDENRLTKSDVVNCKSTLTDKYEKVQTINSYITSINRFLFFCDAGMFRVGKVSGQTENVLQHRIYTHEYKRMYNKAKANGEMELHYIIKLMGGTGIRVDELKSFTSQSIQNKYVSVDNKGKIRKVPLPGPLARELRKYAKTNQLEGPLFTLTYDQIYNGLKRIAGQCKINKSKIHPHAFRHYFGFNFVDRAGDIKLAQLSDILGHSSVETTRIYTRGTLEDYQKTMEEM